MAIQASVRKNVLQFKFDARTSRGTMKCHEVYYITIQEETTPEIVGLGECAPLPGLSMEYSPDFEINLINWVAQFNALKINASEIQFSDLVAKFNLEYWPSLAFALETAILDWQNQGTRIFFNNFFTRSEDGIPINGLIWMGDKSFMQKQIEKKLMEGYSCLKLKIGSLDFDTELGILKQIRQVAPSSELTIRLDANGAFSFEEAPTKLKQLAEFTIHSIEQPIKPKQIENMAWLCSESPIPIALDEELIGVIGLDAQQKLLEIIKPKYIILKPTLLGGLQVTKQWITLAENTGIDWWITSALESNIGLNAISQFTAQYKPKREQGLGTGQLYTQNIASPLEINSGKLFYNPQVKWGRI